MTPVDLGRAPFPPRLLLVEMSREHADLRRDLRAIDPRLLVFRLEADLGGVWTDYGDGEEVIRFGFPGDSPQPYFQVFHPRRPRTTALDFALERMVFARRVTDILCAEPEVVFPVAHALQAADAVIWCEDAACSPADLARHRGLAPMFRGTPAARTALLDSLRRRMSLGVPA